MIASLPIDLVFAVALSALMAWVVISDATRYIISNLLNGLIVALYAVAVFVLPVEPLGGLGAAGATLLVGMGIFALGLMGGGDVKLLVALGFWTGWTMATPQFIFLTAIFGGVLVGIVLLLRWLLPPLWLKARAGKPLPRLLTRKEPVPYGIAIAAAFCWMLWSHMVPGVLPNQATVEAGPVAAKPVTPVAAD